MKVVIGLLTVAFIIKKIIIIICVSNWSTPFRSIASSSAWIPRLWFDYLVFDSYNSPMAGLSRLWLVELANSLTTSSSARMTRRWLDYVALVSYDLPMDRLTRLRLV